MLGLMSKQAPLSFAQALGHEPVDKRLQILRLIHSSGSISQAAREAAISYKAAWQAIDTLGNLAGVALLEREVGGSGGGGARLTAAGVELLAAAELMDSARDKVLAQLARQGGAPALAPRRALQLALRTSMRNQLPCQVVALEIGGPIARVRLRLPLGGELVSAITHESAELLGLRSGQAIVALCKATAVRVRAAASAAAVLAGSGNRLSGRASRISRSSGGDEVSVKLEAGPQMVGFAAGGSGLRARQAVVVEFDPVAVVLALP